MFSFIIVLTWEKDLRGEEKKGQSIYEYILLMNHNDNTEMRIRKKKNNGQWARWFLPPIQDVIITKILRKNLHLFSIG